ncbi:MAG: penicillin-binding protein 1A [Granulosicoccaceae bacterium]
MPISPDRNRRVAPPKLQSEQNSPRRKRGWMSTLFKWLAIFGVSAVLLVAMGVGYLYYTITPDLPDVELLSDVQLQMPLRVYTADGDLITEYGEQRREPVLISAVPENLKNAIIAAEDQHFYTHPGVAWQGLLRAAIHIAKTGKKGPGGSTITMQVARNFFLSNEKTYDRKVREIFLSFKIESTLAKDQILELYINKIYLGNRSYGFAAASKVYYGKEISDIDLAEASMMAGLPKAPSRFNPIVNPERAVQRRNYVLGRMLELDMIDQSAYNAAVVLPAVAALHYSKPEAEASYVGEMVRARVQQLFGEQWSTAGFNVYTTIKSDSQRAANQALRGALFDYERRHGYRGPLATLDAAVLADPELLAKKLDEFPTHGTMMPGAVVAVEDQSATVVVESGSEFVLPFEDIEWAREYIEVDNRGDEITSVTEVLAIGDVIQLQPLPDGSARFVQEPSVEGAFVALEPATGAITALVGGFDYYRSKFNRATQARRQPGSTFKPFIYSAALEAGNTPATIYNDAPVVFHDDALEGEWRPTNYSGKFYGPTRLREALVRSMNLVSVRVLREIGIKYAVEYAQRFGFKAEHLPEDLSLSLGSASVTPIELSAAFAVFANGGFRVTPHFIQRIEDPRGDVIYTTPDVVFCDGCDAAQENPLQAEMAVTEEEIDTAQNNPEGTGDLASDSEGKSLLVDTRLDVINAPRVIGEANAYIMSSMMREVVRRGTGRRAGEALKRNDIGGKTGTTNNQLDAWFTGFHSSVVAAAWIGSDGLDPLGRREAGGIAALPMWTSFMASTLEGVPEEKFKTPDSVESVRIDRRTGQPASGDGTVLEIFVKGNAPEGERPSKVISTGSGSVTTTQVQTVKQQKQGVDDLF